MKKIEYRGVIDYAHQIKATVPKAAVKYIDPYDEDCGSNNKMLYSVLAMLFPVVLVIIKYMIENEIPFVFNILGCIIGCIVLLPHELMHGICFPKEAHVGLYQMIKPSRMFIAASIPVSKARYILMRVFPNFVLGILPLLIWMCISPDTYIAKTLFSIGFINVIAGAEDYMSIVKTVQHVSPFSNIYVAGIKTYYISAK